MDAQTFLTMTARCQMMGPQFHGGRAKFVWGGGGGRMESFFFLFAWEGWVGQNTGEKAFSTCYCRIFPKRTLANVLRNAQVSVSF